MTTTLEHLPMRPRGAARSAATTEQAVFPTRRARRASERTGRIIQAFSPGKLGRTVGPKVFGSAATTTATSTTTTAQAAEAGTLPSRRTLRSEAQPSRAGDLGRAVTQAITLPMRTIGAAVASAKAVPVTATAVAACLFITVATPQTAMASTPQGMLPALDVQEYTAVTGSSIAVERDAFAIGRVPVRTTLPAPSAGASSAGASAVRPVAGSIPAAGGFGSRWVRGCAACSSNHQGLDFAAPTGTAVVAAMSGRVVSAGVFGGYGNQILLQHGDGSQTRYGHLSQIGVRVGQSVSVGERIGAVGNTGVSTGSHLHFEVIIGGVPVNPAAWLQNRGLL